MMYIPMIRAMLTKLNPTVKTPPLQNLLKVLGGAERYDRRRRAVARGMTTVNAVITVK